MIFEAFQLPYSVKSIDKSSSPYYSYCDNQVKVIILHPDSVELIPKVIPKSRIFQR